MSVRAEVCDVSLADERQTENDAGYGPSGENSTCSESANYKSVDAAMRWVQTTHRIPIENIVLYGRSLGGGATVHAAVRNPGGAFVLSLLYLFQRQISAKGDLAIHVHVGCTCGRRPIGV